MSDSHTIEAFLVSISAVALNMAAMSTRDRDMAADMVQEAMSKWAAKYSTHPPAQWRPLFYRVLQNGLRDQARRDKLRHYWVRWFGQITESELDPDFGHDQDPEQELERSDAAAAIDAALRALPERQREAFMLRQWQGLDVRETALAMGCSEGSVKTHLSRAMAQLRTSLGPYWSQDDE